MAEIQIFWCPKFLYSETLLTRSPRGHAKVSVLSGCLDSNVYEDCCEECTFLVTFGLVIGLLGFQLCLLGLFVGSNYFATFASSRH